MNADILGAYAYKPYSYLVRWGVPQKRIDEAFVDTAQAAEHVVEVAGAVALFRHTGFDSEVLGLSTAKVDALAAGSGQACLELAQALVGAFQEMRLDYVTARLSACDLDMIRALESHGFRTVDGYLTLLRPAGHTEPLETCVREARPEDIRLLQDDVAPAFVFSRFFRDPYVSTAAATEMHRLVIRNAILGEIAQQVYVADVGGRPAGFIALEMDRHAERYFNLRMGHIPWIGISPSARGQHLALTLTRAAFGWFERQRADVLRIETQVNNVPATRTYENAGFQLVDSGQTLRWAAPPLRPS